MPWFLYVIECLDGSLYTGVTVNVEKRYSAHVSGKGARYTRSHPPKKLLGFLEYPDQSAALKAEYQVKQLSVQDKLVFTKTLSLRGK